MDTVLFPSIGKETCARALLCPIPGLSLSYRLFRLCRFFYVEVTAEDKNGRRYAKSDGFAEPERAWRFFRLVVKNAVTPYSFAAIYDEQAGIL